MGFKHISNFCILAGALLAGMLLGTGCGSDRNDSACSPGTSKGCQAGLVCEKQGDAAPSCFAPVVARGRTVDLASGAGIAGATVIAVSADGIARSQTAVSDSEGNYSLPVPADRKPGGEPLEDLISLRVAAAGYLSFPTAPREPLLIDLSNAGAMPNDPGGPTPLVVATGATVIGLSPLALVSDTSRNATIEGKLVHELAPGASVVAVQALRAVSSAVADADGAFTLFDVPPGSVQIEAYRSGLRVEPLTLTVQPAERRTGIELSPDARGLGRVSGTLNIVNASSDDLTTSIALMLDSTFEQAGPFARGVIPAGLRATRISTAFSIEAVPPGKYAVLAAFDNDQTVRDPEQSMSGMDVAHIEVPADGQPVDVAQQLNITAALPVESPGASGFEHVTAAEGLTFSWAADPDADGYELRVFDAFGAIVHEALDVPSERGAALASYAASNAQLFVGLPYQFRAVSWRGGAERDTRTYLRATEDLRGVFQIDPNSP